MKLLASKTRQKLFEKLSSYGNTAGASPSFKDARSDLGYGRIDNKWHDQRGRNNYFPYIDPVNEDEDEDDESLEIEDPHLLSLMSKKLNTDIAVNDPLGGYKADPFYFAGSNTSLSIADCFYRTDYVLNEIAAMNSSLVPMPGIWLSLIHI